MFKLSLSFVLLKEFNVVMYNKKYKKRMRRRSSRYLKIKNVKFNTSFSKLFFFFVGNQSKFLTGFLLKYCLDLKNDKNRTKKYLLFRFFVQIFIIFIFFLLNYIHKKHKK